MKSNQAEQRPVLGLEAEYLISSEGTVFSVRSGRNITPQDDCRGYLRVLLYKSGKEHPRKIHRLIAEAFIPNPLSLRCIIHKDGDRRNNSIDNLEWCTHGENNTHRARILMKNIGESHPSNRLSRDDVHQIRIAVEDAPRGRRTGKIKLIARRFGVSPQTIADIRDNKIWKHNHART